MQTPSNACTRSLSPSFTRTLTRTVSPGRNGVTVFIHSFCVSINGCIVLSGVKPRPVQVLQIRRYDVVLREANARAANNTNTNGARGHDAD